MNYLFPHRQEWFECRQFDSLAEAMGVRLADGKTYRLVSKLGAGAQYDYDKGTISFDKKWFGGHKLTARAKAAVVVHELWHAATAQRAISSRRTFRYIGVPFEFARLSAALALFGIIVTIPPQNVWLATILFQYVAVALPIVLVLRFLVIPWYLRKHFWPLEFESDEAAARFIGVAAAEEFLKTFETNSGPPTHPRARDRLRRLKEIAPKYPIPVLDFDTLQAEVRQEFLPLTHS